MEATVLTAADMRTTVLEELAIANDGRIDAHIVLDAARDPANPLHACFDWDDKRAGENFRLLQAGILIRKWRGVIVRQEAEPRRITMQMTRRVQSTSTQRKVGGYETVENIMADPVKREDMRRTVLKELGALRKRWAEIEALSEVWEAIDRASAGIV